MDRSGVEFPIFIAQVGPLNGERWQLSQSLVIGRDATCDIIIPERQVSRYHARLIPSANGVILEDLGSKNGTYCNSVRLEEPRTLEDGDVIQVALVQQFAFLSSDATMPLESGLPVEERPARLQLDERSRRVWVGGQEVLPPLSVAQFRLLQLLYTNHSQLVTRDELIDAVWGSKEAEGVSEEALDALVRRLRDRLSAIDRGHQYIITVRGHGLRLENPSE